MAVVTEHGTVLTDAYIADAIAEARARGVSQAKIDEFIAHNPDDYQRLWNLEPDQRDPSTFQALGTGQYLDLTTGLVSGSRAQVASNLALNNAGVSEQQAALALDAMLTQLGLGRSAFETTSAVGSTGIAADIDSTQRITALAAGPSGSAIGPTSTGAAGSFAGEQQNYVASPDDAVIQASLFGQGGPSSPPSVLGRSSNFLSGGVSSVQSRELTTARPTGGFNMMTLLVLAAMAFAVYYLMKKGR